MNKWSLLFSFSLVVQAPAYSGVLMNQEEALTLVFPEGAAVDRRSLFIRDESVKEIEERAKSKLDSQLVNYYVGRTTAGVAGYAFFHTHQVRTMPETLMVAVNPDGSLRLVEILAFYEPDDYRPPRRWLDLYSGKKLDDDLWVKRGIRNIAGATLSTRAITDAVRRTLAIFEISIMPGESRKR